MMGTLLHSTCKESFLGVPQAKFFGRFLIAQRPCGNGLKNKTITPSPSLLTTTTSKREESTLFEPT